MRFTVTYPDGTKEIMNSSSIITKFQNSVNIAAIVNLPATAIRVHTGDGDIVIERVSTDE